MRRLALVPVVLVATLSPFVPALGADQNGYTSQFECRSGNSRCDVNMAAVTTRACDQTIFPSTSPTNSWSAINWSNDTICIAPGDHRARGVLSVSGSGSAGARRVIRASTGTTAPWNQAPGDRARISRLDLNGAAYWIIQGLAIDDTVNATGVYFVPNSGANNNIVDHVLVQNHDNILVHFMWGNYANTLQNSVVRSSRAGDKENNCVSIGGSADSWITNNEIYNCNKAVSAGSGVWDILGAKIENNDLYVSQDIYSDCNGNYTPSNANSPCAANEAVISLKAGGNAARPVAIVHNRIWGARAGDPVILGGINSGEAPSISVSNDLPDHPEYPGADYLLIQNNIIWDAQVGIGNWWGTPDHLSVIGNLFYNIRRQQNDHPGYAIRMNRVSNAEFYFNTIIQSQRWIELISDVQETDVRCNLVIDSPDQYGTGSSGAVIDNNAFFNSAVAGAHMMAFSSSSSSGSSDYCFKRKLLTGAEQVCIPKAKPTSSSPYVGACDSSTGSRRNVGVSDDPIL